MPPKPPVVAELVWSSRLAFAANLSNTAIVVDSSGVEGPSPMELLGAALAGCMAADLGHILNKGRHPFSALRAKLTADRTPENPQRITAVSLHFVVEGDIPRDAVERAIALSRDKYCSVWHSLRQDIELQVTFDLVQ